MNEISPSALAPTQRLTDVSSELNSVAITTFDVDPDLMRSRLPAFLRPETVQLPQVGLRALVSAVTFLNTRFFVGFAPFVKLSCYQTNYRAYVRCNDDRAVWFFATSLGTPFVFLPRTFWRLPWHHARFRCDSRWNEGRCDHYVWRAGHAHGEEHIDARGTGQPMGVLPGFDSEEQTREILTDPMVGYLRRRSGQVATYSVWHPPFELERAESKAARFELFETLGLVEPGQVPHSVLVQPRIPYLIFLPPKNVRVD